MVTSHQNVITEDEYELLAGWEQRLCCFRSLLSHWRRGRRYRRQKDDLQLSFNRPSTPISFTSILTERRKEKLMIFGIGRLIDPSLFTLYFAYFGLSDGWRTIFFFLPSRVELKPLVKLKDGTISQHRCAVVRGRSSQALSKWLMAPTSILIQ